MQLLTEVESARYLRVSLSFLRNARWRGFKVGTYEGPPVIRVGRSVRYDRADLDTWLNARRRPS